MVCSHIQSSWQQLGSGKSVVLSAKYVIYRLCFNCTVVFLTSFLGFLFILAPLQSGWPSHLNPYVCHRPVECGQGPEQGPSCLATQWMATVLLVTLKALERFL